MLYTYTDTMHMFHRIYFFLLHFSSPSHAKNMLNSEYESDHQARTCIRYWKIICAFECEPTISASSLNLRILFHSQDPEAVFA